MSNCEEGAGHCANKFSLELNKLNKLAKSGKIEDDLSGILDDFWSKINQIDNPLDINFSEVALVLQASILFWGRKVKLLWDFLLDCQHNSLKLQSKASRAEIEKVEERINRRKRKKIKLNITAVEDENQQEDENALRERQLQKWLAFVAKVKAFPETDEEIGSWNKIIIEDVKQEDCYIVGDEHLASYAHDTLPWDQVMHIMQAYDGTLPEKYIDIPGEFPGEIETFDAYSFVTRTATRDAVFDYRRLLNLGTNGIHLIPKKTSQEYMFDLMRENNIQEWDIEGYPNLFRKLMDYKLEIKREDLLLHPEPVDDFLEDTFFTDAVTSERTDECNQRLPHLSVIIERLPDEILQQYTDQLVQPESNQLIEQELHKNENGITILHEILISNEPEQQSCHNLSDVIVRIERLPNVTLQKYLEKAAQEQVDGDEGIEADLQSCDYTPSKRSRTADSGFFDSMSFASSFHSVHPIMPSDNIVTSTPMKRKKSTDDLIDGSIKRRKTVLKSITVKFASYELFHLKNYIPEEEEGVIDKSLLENLESDINDSENIHLATQNITDDSGIENITQTTNESINNIKDLTTGESDVNDSDDDVVIISDTLPRDKYCGLSSRQNDENDAETKRNNEFKTRMRLKLLNKENADKFDVHEYEDNILESFPDSKTMKFSSFAAGKSREDICRYFIASLHLVNNQNISFSKIPAGELANDHLEMNLLSTEKHHKQFSANDGQLQESIPNISRKRKYNECSQ